MVGGEGGADGGAGIAGGGRHEHLIKLAVGEDLADADAVHRDAAAHAQLPGAGYGPGAAGQVDHHLLGALLQRCREVGVDLDDLLTGEAGRAGGSGEGRGDTRPAVPEHPQREQGRVEREPGGRERDRAGEQGAEPCRVAERGQGHHRAFFVAAPPPQMRCDGAVGVTQGCGIADRLDDPVPDIPDRDGCGRS